MRSSTNLLIYWSVETVHSYSGGTNRSGEPCYNFERPYSDLIFSAWIHGCDSGSPALLNLSICSVVAFPPLKSSYHVGVSVSIDFRSNSMWGRGKGECPPFHRTAFDWDGLRDHLRDVLLEDIFKGTLMQIWKSPYIFKFI